MFRVKISLLLLTPTSLLCRAWQCLQAAKNVIVENGNGIIQNRFKEHPNIPVHHPQLSFISAPKDTHYTEPAEPPVIEQENKVSSCL